MQVRYLVKYFYLGAIEYGPVIILSPFLIDGQILHLYLVIALKKGHREGSLSPTNGYGMVRYVVMSCRLRTLSACCFVT